MKQYITIEQLEELSQSARLKLREYMLKEWARPMKDPLGNWVSAQIPTDDYQLSIGQMIEFLEWNDMQFYQTAKTYTKIPMQDRGKWNVQDGDYENAGKHYLGEELCDALWEAVKELLEK